MATEIKACLTRIAEPGEQSVMELGHAIGGMILQLRLQDASLRFYQFPRMILVSQLLVVIKTLSWKQLVQFPDVTVLSLALDRNRTRRLFSACFTGNNVSK